MKKFTLDQLVDAANKFYTLELENGSLFWNFIGTDWIKQKSCFDGNFYNFDDVQARRLEIFLSPHYKTLYKIAQIKRGIRSVESDNHFID